MSAFRWLAGLAAVCLIAISLFVLSRNPSGPDPYQDSSLPSQSSTEGEETKFTPRDLPESGRDPARTERTEERGSEPPVEEARTASTLQGSIDLTGPREALAGTVVYLCAGISRPLVSGQRSIASSFGRLVELRPEATEEALERPREFLARVAVDPEGTFRFALPELPPSFHLRVLGPRLLQTSWVTHSAPAREEGEEPLVQRVEVAARAAAEVEGIVVDLDGRPVDGATVVLREEAQDLHQMRGLSRTSERVARVTKTDAEGRFAFEALEPGEGLALRVGAGSGGTHRSARLDGLALAAGERREVRLSLEGGLEISGKVVTENGEPVLGARVLCGPSAVGFGHLESVDDPTGTEALTDEQGRFRLAGLAAISHFLLAECEGFAPSAVSQVDPAERGEPVVIHLEDSRELRGEVRLPDGSPAPGCVVRLTRFLTQNTFMGSIGRPTRIVETTTDAAGSFLFDTLEEGSFDLRAESPDGSLVASATNVSNRLRRGKPPEPVVLTLAPFASLEGRVVEADGSSVTRFSLELRSKVLVVLPAIRASGTFADPEGRFRLEGLLPGKYELAVRLEGCQTHLVPGVEVPASEELRIELPARGGLRGRVYEEASGAPLGGVRIRVQQHPFVVLGAMMSGTSHEAVTDAEGRFELLGIPAGEISLDVEHDTFVASRVTTLEVPEGEVRENVVLHMTRGGVIEGHVYGDDGAPQAGVTVEAQVDMFGLEKRDDRTDENGFYRLVGLPSGTARMSAIDLEAMAKSGMAGVLSSLRTRSVRVEPQATVVVNFGEAGTPGTRLHGTVTINDEPARGVLLFATFEALAEDDVRLASCDAKGEYAFENVPAGLCRLRVVHMTAYGQSVHPQEVEVAAAVAEQRFDVALSVGKLSGKVTTPEGEGLANVQVTLRSQGTAEGEEAFVAFATTGEDGKYEFAGLRAGTYEVRAGGPQFIIPGSNVTEAVRSDLVIAGREELLDVDFRLSPGGTIRGKVVDAAGEPVAGVAIFAELEPAKEEEGVPDGITAPDGTFELRGVEAGPNRVRARAAGFLDAEERSVSVVPPQVRDLRITLRRGIRVRVLVEGTDGERIEGCRAHLLDASGAVARAGVAPMNFGQAYGILPSDRLELGAFEPGSYRLVVDLPDGRKLESALELRGAPGSVEEVRLRAE